MPEYTPEQLAFASLDSDEIHHHSFFVYGVKPKSVMFQDYPDGSTYIGHLTNKRVILEPWKLPGFVSVAIGVASIVGTAISPSVGIDGIIKGLSKQAKSSLARTAFLAENQQYFSIRYQDIINFETKGKSFFITDLYVRIVTNVGSDKDAFLQRVEKITDGAKRGIGGEPGTKTNRNFCDYGNKLLNEYRSTIAND